MADPHHEPDGIPGQRTMTGMRLTDALKGVGIVCALFAASVFIPVLGFFFALMIPLPIIWYRLKLGRRQGMMIGGAAGLIIAGVIGRVSFDTLFIVELMILGYAMAECFEQGRDADKTILWTSGAVLAAGVIAVWGYAGTQGVETGEVLSAYIAGNIRLALDLYEEMRIPEEAIRTLSENLETIQRVFIQIVPGMVASFVMFIAWVTYLSAAKLLRRVGWHPPDKAPLNHWSPPDGLIWALILCCGVMFIGVSGIRILAVNGLIILLTVYFFAGMAVVSFFMEKKGFSRGIRFMIYGLIAFQQLALAGVIAVGIFDLWLNFRRLTPRGT